ncbi:MAG TPA: hypothetical protein PLG47_00110 [Candidatus Dojkabacteria bacterium]|nr:hypothetical protein [Candidatus Dojkabacteria bacterium]
MRKIIVYSTKGKSGSFESDAKTWGEVQNDVRNIVGDLDNLIATENVNKTNLGHQDSVLPEGDFKIFLRPAKTKSGATDFSSMSFRECRAFIADKGQACKDYLNAEAKKSDRNWTQLSTEELQKYLSSYSGGKSSSSSSSKTSAKATKAAEEVSEEDLAREFNEIEKGFC